MTDRAIVAALNGLSDKLNEAAAALDTVSRYAYSNNLVPRLEHGSPLARMVEQCDRAAAMMPEPREPTKWDPPESC
ncbi:hypothetical protein ACTGJ9_013750 [Bradyrhizobium sp. RDM12]